MLQVDLLEGQANESANLCSHTGTQADFPASAQLPDQQQALHGRIEACSAEHDNTIALLESQLSAATKECQDAQQAAQLAQQALLEHQTEAASHLQAESHRAGFEQELLQAQADLHSQATVSEQLQAELQLSAATQSELTQQTADLTQQLAETTQHCSVLREQLAQVEQQLSAASAQLEQSEVSNSQQQSLLNAAQHQIQEVTHAKNSLHKSCNVLRTELDVVRAQSTAKIEELAELHRQLADSQTLNSRLSQEMEQLAQDSASSTKVLQAQLGAQSHNCKKLQQQLQEAETAGASEKAAAEQLQRMLQALQAGNAQLEQTAARLTQQLSTQAETHSAEVTALQQQAHQLAQQLDTQKQARVSDSAQQAEQLRTQSEGHTAELASMSAEQARAVSRSEQLLTELQAAQESCQALLRQAADTEAATALLRAEVQGQRSSLQDRDDLILDLDTQIKVTWPCSSSLRQLADAAVCLCMHLVQSSLNRPSYRMCIDFKRKLRIKQNTCKQHQQHNHIAGACNDNALQLRIVQQ